MLVATGDHGETYFSADHCSPEQYNSVEHRREPGEGALTKARPRKEAWFLGADGAGSPPSPFLRLSLETFLCVFAASTSLWMR